MQHHITKLQSGFCGQALLQVKRKLDELPEGQKKEKMNGFYKVFNLILFIHNLFIIVGILLTVIASKSDFMMYYLALTGCSVLFQWIIIFILFLIEFLFHLKKIINRKKLIFSIIVIIVHYYLTYLCMVTYKPDFFTLTELIFSTKRFFLHILLMDYWFILQGLSYIIVAIKKNKKQLHGFRINASLSIYRVIFLWLSLSPFLLFDKTNVIDLNEFIIVFILVSLIYFIISVIIELSIDFILQRDLANNV